MAISSRRMGGWCISRHPAGTGKALAYTSRPRWPTALRCGDKSGSRHHPDHRRRLHSAGVRDVLACVALTPQRHDAVGLGGSVRPNQEQRHLGWWSTPGSARCVNTEPRPFKIYCRINGSTATFTASLLALPQFRTCAYFETWTHPEPRAKIVTNWTLRSTSKRKRVGCIWARNCVYPAAISRLAPRPLAPSGVVFMRLRCGPGRPGALCCMRDWPCRSSSWRARCRWFG